MSGPDEDEDDPMDAQSWYGTPDVCGSCIAWRPEAPRAGEHTAAGSCKLRPEIGRVGADLKKCNRYMPRGSFKYTPKSSPIADKRRRSKTLAILRPGAENAEVRSRSEAGSSTPRPAAPRPAPRAEAPIPKVEPTTFGPPKPRPPRPAPPATVDLGGNESGPVVRQAIVELIRQELGRSRRELHPRFKQGEAISRTTDGKEQSVRIERFFASLDHLQNALDGLEKALDRAKPKLGAEHGELQQSIRGIRGSFTTYNLLYADRDDWFSSKE